MTPVSDIGGGRSTKDALRKVWGEIAEGDEWIVDADRKNFFGLVDYDKLLTLVNQRVSEGRVLRLIDQMLKAGCSAEGKWLETEQGTAQDRGCLPDLEPHSTDSV
jgi:RNA-directed DNA polymerase